MLPSGKKFLLLFFLVLLFAPIACSAALEYKLMEGIPGFAQANSSVDFPAYIMAIYKFGLWTIGLAALLMIMIGGFMYITSAGNNSQTGKAKGIITDAIAGLLLALVSYLLLYTINPDLVKITPLENFGTGGGTGGSGGSGTGGGSFTCNDGKCTQIDSAISNNSSGIDGNILKSIMVGGEGCDPAYSSDGKGSCGYSQALPDIRSWCGITDPDFCGKVKSGDANAIQEDVNCAAKLIKDNSGRCGMDVQNVASCYNSGSPNNCSNTTNNYCSRVQSYYDSCQSN